MNLAGTLDQQIRAAGIAIVSVSIVDAANKSTWTVQPPELQASAQPIIDAFNVPDQELLWQWYVVRTERDKLLYGCDWTQISGAPLDAGQVTEWADYRTALRNVPDEQSDPFAITWPTPPWPINPPPS
tara:strand:+ start:2694 stop:3077 length:384 start_codon:yes stop_codon:yes gene_type:complete